MQASDAAVATISAATADRLVGEATPKGRRLLELFADHQIVHFSDLMREFETNQEGLNALLGRLTREFRSIQGDGHFYLYLPDEEAWAIDLQSRQQLRRALREAEAARQRRIDFQAGEA